MSRPSSTTSRPSTTGRRTIISTVPASRGRGADRVQPRRKLVGAQVCHRSLPRCSNCPTAVAASSRPIARLAVAAGDGAFCTCRTCGPRAMAKSSTSEPLRRRAWARIPDGPQARSARAMPGVNRWSARRKSRSERSRTISAPPARQYRPARRRKPRSPRMPASSRSVDVAPAVALPGVREHGVRAGPDGAVDPPREVDAQEREARVRHGVDEGPAEPPRLRAAGSRSRPGTGRCGSRPRGRSWPRGGRRGGRRR